MSVPAGADLFHLTRGPRSEADLPAAFKHGALLLKAERGDADAKQQVRALGDQRRIERERVAEEQRVAREAHAQQLLDQAGN